MFERGDAVNALTDINARELDHRTNDGIDVTLFWSPQSNRLWVAVYDERHDDSFEIEVDPSEALDAFHHPYVYADSADDYALAA